MTLRVSLSFATGMTARSQISDPRSLRQVGDIEESFKE